VNVFVGRQAQLTCSNQLASFARDVLPWLPGLSLGLVREAALVNCPLPEASLADVLAALGATGVKFLTFRDSAGSGGGSSSPLAPFHLANLSNVLHLGLMRNAIPALDQTFFESALAASLASLDLTGNKGIRLHDNAFAALVNLKELKLIDCELAGLSEGVFDPLMRLEILNLYSNSLKELPAGLFKNLAALKTLSLRNNQFESLPLGIFDNLTSLEELELGNSFFRTLPPNLLVNNLKLKRVEFLVNGRFCPPQRPGCEAAALKLNLTGSLFNNPSLEVVKMLHVPLVDLTGGLFSNCGNLRNLTVQSAYIERLPAGLFEQTPLLELIDLAGNKLTNISSGTFTGLTNLRTLRLLSNRIATIDSNAFSGLVGLEVLQLHQNQLLEIGGALLRDLTRLEILHLQQNQIQAVHATALATNGKLRVLDLAFNNITLQQGGRQGRFLAGQVFESLEVLNLTHNNISYLEESLLNNFLQLRFLNLSHNAFSLLNPLDMAFIKNGRLTLDLSFNQIETFSLEASPEAVFIYNTSTEYSLRLGGNPLRCDCYLSELRQKVTDELVSVISDKIQLEDGDQLTCGPASGGQLAGRLLSAVRYKELSCAFPSPVLRDEAFQVSFTFHFRSFREKRTEFFAFFCLQ
jgi:Leucine-rich repeat (LRR) protein